MSYCGTSLTKKFYHKIKIISHEKIRASVKDNFASSRRVNVFFSCCT